MYDNYGIYASCRDAAWRFLIDFNICSLPVKLKTAAKMAGIRIVRNSDVKELRGNEVGASIFLPSKEWVIVYDDALKVNEARMVIAHELGHILLGHEYKYSEQRFAYDGKKLKSEREADMFALRILAPACVLHEIGAVNAGKIYTVCDIPIKHAAARAKRMATLEKRNFYYKSELESKVRDKFQKYIDQLTDNAAH